MSSKTKIVVLHMKELVFTLIAAALGILLICFLLFLVSSDADTDAGTPETDPPSTESVSSTNSYVPGLYTTELVLNDRSVNIEVTLSENEITAIELTGLDEDIASMYPLLEPTFASIKDQVLLTQSPEDISYEPTSKYTSLVILESIKNSIEKAQP
ncbi:MAG: hypothetical protein IJZ82_10850 [Lachnospiraceae bacterium]|nr:hypothetical protein [Lachnospiraceae bacterium]